MTQTTIDLVNGTATMSGGAINAALQRVQNWQNALVNADLSNRQYLEARRDESIELLDALVIQAIG